MSKLEPETIRKVAELARLELSNSEIERFGAQLSGVLEYIAKLQELDTTAVEPMNSPIDIPTPLREDVSRPGPGTAALLSCAPESLYDNFKVPQMMGGEKQGE